MDKIFVITGEPYHENSQILMACKTKELAEKWKLENSKTYVNEYFECLDITECELIEEQNND